MKRNGRSELARSVTFRLLAVLVSLLVAAPGAGATCPGALLATAALGVAVWPFASLFCPDTAGDPSSPNASLVVRRECDGTYTASGHYFDSSQSSFNNNHQVVELFAGGTSVAGGQYNAVTNNASAAFAVHVHGDGTGGYSGADTTFGPTSFVSTSGCTPITPPANNTPTYSILLYQDQVTHDYHFTVNVDAGSGGGLALVNIIAVTNVAGSPAKTKVGGGFQTGSQTTAISGTFSQTLAPGAVGIQVQVINTAGGQVVIGGGGVAGASGGGPPVAGGGSTGSTTGSTTAGSGSTSAGTGGLSGTATAGGTTSATPPTETGASDSSAPSWWSWLLTHFVAVIKWLLLPDPASVDSLKAALQSLTTAGPFALVGTVQTAAHGASATDYALPTSASITMPGGSVLVVEHPWDGIPMRGGYCTLLRRVIQVCFWALVTVAIMKYLRPRIVA